MAKNDKDKVLLQDKVLEGRFKILSVLGRGGVGIVYKAKHLHMDKYFAIKMLLSSEVATETDFLRFQREARAASTLTHPNIIAVHDFGKTSEGHAYLVMEYLEGKNLDDVLDQCGSLNLEQFRLIFKQVCDGLQYAHSKGLVHRDIKPSNIMLIDTEDMQDVVKIVDFGLAKSSKQETSQKLTETGAVIGTPLFMSPEQCRGLRLDHRSDIYSLACVMHCALTGKFPFQGDSAIDTILKHLVEPPPKLSAVVPQLNYPPELEQLICKALEKEPDARQQSMSELRDDIENALKTTQTSLTPDSSYNPAAVRTLAAWADLRTAIKLAAKTNMYDATDDGAFNDGTTKPIGRRNEGRIDRDGKRSHGLKRLAIGGVVVAFLGLASAAVLLNHNAKQTSPDHSQSNEKALPTSKPDAHAEGANKVATVATPHDKPKTRGHAAPGEKPKTEIQASPTKVVPAPTKPVAAIPPAKKEVSQPQHTPSHKIASTSSGVDKATLEAAARSWEAQANIAFVAQDWALSRAKYEQCLQRYRAAYGNADSREFIPLARILSCLQKEGNESMVKEHLEPELQIFSIDKKHLIPRTNKSNIAVEVWRTLGASCLIAAKLSDEKTRADYLGWAADFYELALNEWKGEPDSPDRIRLARSYHYALKQSGQDAEAVNVAQTYHLFEGFRQKQPKGIISEFRGDKRRLRQLQP